jgi:hypothetical protein
MPGTTGANRIRAVRLIVTVTGKPGYVVSA